MDYEQRPEFEPIDLPSESLNIERGGGYSDNPNFQRVALYVQSLGEQIFKDEIYWSPINLFNKRFIIPFYFQNTIVGYTARYYEKNAPKNIPKYMTKCSDGFLFNNHFLDDWNRKYIILVEGPLDARAVNGVAYLKDTLEPKQIAWLRSSGKEIILLPDRGKSARAAIEQAIEQNWYVSMPRDWDHDIKDAHDAYLKYGALVTVESIIDNRINNEAAIKQFWKDWK